MDFQQINPCTTQGYCPCLGFRYAKIDILVCVISPVVYFSVVLQTKLNLGNPNNDVCGFSELQREAIRTLLKNKNLWSLWKMYTVSCPITHTYTHTHTHRGTLPMKWLVERTYTDRNSTNVCIVAGSLHRKLHHSTHTGEKPCLCNIGSILVPSFIAGFMTERWPLSAVIVHECKL